MRFFATIRSVESLKTVCNFWNTAARGNNLFPLAAFLQIVSIHPPLSLFVAEACSASALRLPATWEWPFRSLGWFGAGGDCFCEASIKLIEGRTHRLLKGMPCGGRKWGRTLCFVLCALCEVGREGILVLPFYWIGRRWSFRPTLLQLSGLIGVQHRNMGNVLSQGGLLRGDPLRPV